MSRLVNSGLTTIVSNMGALRGQSYQVSSVLIARGFSSNDAQSTCSSSRPLLPYGGPAKKTETVNQLDHMDKGPSVSRGLPPVFEACCNRLQPAESLSNYQKTSAIEGCSPCAKPIECSPCAKPKPVESSPCAKPSPSCSPCARPIEAPQPAKASVCSPSRADKPTCSKGGVRLFDQAAYRMAVSAVKTPQQELPAKEEAIEVAADKAESKASSSPKVDGWMITFFRKITGGKKAAEKNETQ